MKRAGGVVASGVVSIIGSLLAILIGLGLILATIAMRATPLPAGAAAPPINVGTVLVVEAGFMFGFGVIGIVSAIGLLKLKNWARISFLVFAGLLGAFSIMGMLGTFVASILAPQMILPEQQQPPAGFFTAFIVVSTIIWLALAGPSAWWLYYFTRRSVKEQFLTGAQIDQARRGPLSVTIIAWLLTVGACLGSLVLFMPYPVFMFGMAFTGWTARLVIALFNVSGLLAGVGMLRWRAQAHTLALCIYGCGLLSTILTLILPGSTARLQATMQVNYPQNMAVPVFTSSFVWMLMLFSVIAVGVPLWFLITRRQAFLQACSVSNEP